MNKWLKALLEISVAGGLGYLSGGPAGAATASTAYLYRNGLVSNDIVEGAKHVIAKYISDKPSDPPSD